MSDVREDGPESENTADVTPPQGHTSAEDGDATLEADPDPMNDDGVERPLHETLLSDPPVPSHRRPESRWAYPLWGILLVSIFVAYQTSTLLVWNTPSKGLAKTFHKEFLDGVYGYKYFNAARLNQSWAMFAPNPNRTNTFVRVFVEDQEGELWDYRQDIWGIDRYPYLWYDRGGKINRRINGKKHYQRIYGTWVCRDWERNHEGEPAKSVTFVRRYTKVPHWNVVIKQGGWDQWKAPFKQKEQETITCKTTVHAQLPERLYDRYGIEMDEDDEKRFRPVKQRTWWDKAEAERKKDERKAKQEAKRAEWEARREARKAKAKTSGNNVGAAARQDELDARGPIRRPAHPAVGQDEEDEAAAAEEDEVDH